jgi:hypothetical protein
MMPEKKQAKVWAGIRKARGLLASARQLEHDIEVERVKNAVRQAQQHGYYPDRGVTNHDPLGSRLADVIKELEDILS